MRQDRPTVGGALVGTGILIIVLGVPTASAAFAIGGVVLIITGLLILAT